MRRFGLLTQEYPPFKGGVGRLYHKLVEESEGELQVYPPEWVQARPWYAGVWPVLRWIKQRDLRHVLVGHVLPLGTIMWVVHMLTGVPYSVYIHGMDISVPQEYARKRWLIRRILRKSSHVITVSNYTKGRIIEFDNQLESKISIISPGPFLGTDLLESAEIPLNDNSPQPPYIVSIGRVVERKGFDTTLRAIHLLRESGKCANLKYKILGSGQDVPRLKRLIKELSLESVVTLHPNLSDLEVAVKLADSIGLVMPSRVVENKDFEGFGIVVLEANVFGKVAIGGDTAGMQDAILNGETGLLVDPHSVEELAGAIEWIHTKTEERIAMEKVAKQWVEATHKWDKKYRTLAHLLEQS